MALTRRTQKKQQTLHAVLNSARLGCHTRRRIPHPSWQPHQMPWSKVQHHPLPTLSRRRLSASSNLDWPKRLLSNTHNPPPPPPPPTSPSFLFTIPFLSLYSLSPPPPPPPLYLSSLTNRCTLPTIFSQWMLAIINDDDDEAFAAWKPSPWLPCDL